LRARASLRDCRLVKEHETLHMRKLLGLNSSEGDVATRKKTGAGPAACGAGSCHAGLSLNATGRRPTLGAADDPRLRSQPGLDRRLWRFCSPGCTLARDSNRPAELALNVSPAEFARACLIFRTVNTTCGGSIARAAEGYPMVQS
jgi:hypothetical protein